MYMHMSCMTLTFLGLESGRWDEEDDDEEEKVNQGEDIVAKYDGCEVGKLDNLRLS